AVRYHPAVAVRRLSAERSSATATPLTRWRARPTTVARQAVPRARPDHQRDRPVAISRFGRGRGRPHLVNRALTSGGVSVEHEEPSAPVTDCPPRHPCRLPPYGPLVSTGCYPDTVRSGRAAFQ